MRSILTIILVISILGLIMWIVCFFMDICGWIGGLIPLSMILLSCILMPRYNYSKSIPSPKRGSPRIIEDDGFVLEEYDELRSYKRYRSPSYASKTPFI